MSAATEEPLEVESEMPLLRICDRIWWMAVALLKPVAGQRKCVSCIRRISRARPAAALPGPT